MRAQQLKNSILQMAMQGKLIAQDPDDEPASMLLERIRAEKAQLVKEGKIKRDKNESVIYRDIVDSRGSAFLERMADGTVRDITEEIPFDVPKGWEWVRLGNIGTWGSGATPNKSTAEYFVGGTIPWLLTGDLNDGHVSAIPGKITELALAKTSVRLNPAGSVLIAMYGATIGKVGILDIAATTNQACCACVPLEGVFNEYLFYFLMSQRTAFQKRGEGGAQPNISKEKIVATLFPLPPIAEQHRIIGRIGQLLPHIATYDIVEQTLVTLNTSFPNQLKKSILQAAVKGKLVPQDPDDEPATVLLECIRAEHEQLICEGKLKPHKTESHICKRGISHYETRNNTEVCIDDELPFDIPDSWAWVRLGSICTVARGGSPRPIQEYLTDDSNGINWIKISDTGIGGKYISSTKEKIKPEGVSKSRKVYSGDFLLTNSMSFGRPYILKVDGCIHDGWLVLSGYQNSLDTDFFYYALSSRFAYYQFCEKVSGAVVKNLNSDKVANSLFPLPPLAEQHRIAAKIQELFACVENM